MVLVETLDHLEHGSWVSFGKLEEILYIPSHWRRKQN